MARRSNSDDDATCTSSTDAARPGAVRLPALTVLWHSDARRVGERVVLPDPALGEEVELSRHAPLFAAPGALSREPLADQSVSRTPLRVRGLPNGLALSSDKPRKVMLNGRPLESSWALGMADLDAGAVLELSAEVALVLHRCAPPPAVRNEPLGFIGQSDALQQVRERLLNVAPHDVTVLLLGESGTGKELAARAIHEQSPRRNADLVCVSMASIPTSLAASSLFGHRKGAFTGAPDHHRGYFEAARGGTLFLDEIGAAPLDIQAALLRALETGEIQAVGATQPTPVNARVVAATDVNLEQAVAEGRFLLPLLHRLRGYALTLPPLRERREDFGPLLGHFLVNALGARATERLRPGADGRAWLPARLVAELAQQRFSGNVRELRNVAQRLAIDWGAEPRVLLDTIAGLVTSQPALEPTSIRPASPPPDPPRGVPTDRDVLAALKRLDYSASRVAEELGISRTTVYEVIKRNPDSRKAADLTAEQIRAPLAEHQGDVEHTARSLRVSERGLRLRLKQLGNEELLRMTQLGDAKRRP